MRPGEQDHCALNSIREQRIRPKRIRLQAINFFLDGVTLRFRLGLCRICRDDTDNHRIEEWRFGRVDLLAMSLFIQSRPRRIMASDTTIGVDRNTFWQRGFGQVLDGHVWNAAFGSRRGRRRRS